MTERVPADGAFGTPADPGASPAEDSSTEDSSADNASADTKKHSSWRELPVLLVIAIILALLVRTFVLQQYYIPSGSMEKTLHGCPGCHGDRVLVDKVEYHVRDIARGNVIVFVSPTSWRTDPQDKDWIKRVVGLPGDHVSCCDKQGRLMVNGKALDEPYVYPGDAPSSIPFTITVPNGRLFLCGDHRSDSDDSRRHLDYSGGTGTISEDAVIGRAFSVVWPPSRWKGLGSGDTFKGVPPPP